MNKIVIALILSAIIVTTVLLLYMLNSIRVVRINQPRFVGLYGSLEGPIADYVLSKPATGLWNFYIFNAIPSNITLLDVLAGKGIRIVLDLYLFTDNTKTAINYQAIDSAFTRLEPVKEDVWAVTLGEENPISSLPLLQKMYDYIKFKWNSDFRLYQWMASWEGVSQGDLSLSADGYAADPYGFDKQQFESHMDFFVKTGKQVLDVLYMGIELGYVYNDTWREQLPYLYQHNVWTVMYTYYYSGPSGLQGYIPVLVGAGYDGQLKAKNDQILSARTYLSTGSS